VWFHDIFVNSLLKPLALVRLCEGAAAGAIAFSASPPVAFANTWPEYERKRLSRCEVSVGPPVEFLCDERRHGVVTEDLLTWQPTDNIGFTGRGPDATRKG
jgi:hypothetical protein